MNTNIKPITMKKVIISIVLLTITLGLKAQDATERAILQRAGISANDEGLLINDEGHRLLRQQEPPEQVGRLCEQHGLPALSDALPGRGRGMDAIARQPEATGKIQTNMILTSAFVEGCALFAIAACAFLI